MKNAYNTNLAAEFFVLSMLYRKGMNAYLTLGNKKSVDIILEHRGGKILTIDVKGLMGKTSWRMGNNGIRVAPNHYYTLVSFKGKISDQGTIPEAWIIPGGRAKNFLYHNKKAGYFIQRRRLVQRGARYLENWKLLK